MTTAGFSRRQLLTVAGLTVGVGVVELGGFGSPAGAAPADTPLTLEPVAGSPVPVFTPDHGAPAVCPKQLAVKVVSGVALPAGTRVSVTFDHRLFAPVQPAAVTLGGRVLGSTSTVTLDRDTGVSTCTVTLSEAVAAPALAKADLVMVMGTAKPLAYPDDIVRKPKGAAVDAAAPGHPTRTRRSLQPDRPGSFGGPVTPWGLGLGGIWAMRTWGANNEFWYYYPVGVTVSAAGPGRMPAGAAFAVAVDPQVVQHMAVNSARLDEKPFRGSVRLVRTLRTAGLYQTEWRTSAALAPGQTLHVRFDVTTATPSGPLATIKHPTITDLMGASTAQRETGLETASRQDSRWA